MGHGLEPVRAKLSFYSIYTVRLRSQTFPNMPFDITKSRDRFPALQQNQVFLDNAGGSQTLGDVINS